MKRGWFVFAVLVCLCQPAAAQTHQKSVAVIDFENVNKDKSLDWLGTGIAETLTTQLSHMREISVVERTRLQDALKEIKFNRSEFVDPGTASQVGRVVGADSIVLGAYQKFEDQIRLTARLVDVETGKVAAPTRVDGNYREIFALQDTLAANLAREIKGTLAEVERQQLKGARTTGLEAYQFFSDGVYYLRSGLVEDALAQFDQALKLDPAYGEAHFYRGIALEKRQRWEEAIAALKRALPRSEPVRRVKWTLEIPYEGKGSKRGQIYPIDIKDVNIQELFFKQGRILAPRRIIYTERVGKNTVLHLVDLEQRSAQRVLIPDDQVPLTQIALGTDRVIVVEATETVGFGMPPEKVTLYGIGVSDGRLWWRGELTKLGGWHPRFGVFGNIFFVYFPAGTRMIGADAATWQLKWERKLELSFADVGVFRHSRSHGDVLILKSRAEKKLHVVRLEDGTDAWVRDLESEEANILASEDIVVALEPDKRIAAFNLDTGEPLLDLPVRTWAYDMDMPIGMATFKLVPALLHENLLYCLSKDKILYALDLRTSTKVENRTRWQVPLDRRLRTLRQHGERLYLGAESGELVILDAASGGVVTATKIADSNLSVEHASDKLVIASSKNFIYGLEATTGAKKWEYPAKFTPKEARYFQGVVIVRTGDKQLSVLAVDTGALLWQYTGKRLPGVYTTEDSLFIAEEEGVKEYAVETTVSPGLTDKEVLTELARTSLSMGNLEEAGWYLNKVTREIDPDYPTARLLHSRLLKARGDKRAALRELIIYQSLVGYQSQQAQEILEELKREYGLRWQTRLEGPRGMGVPREVQGKIVSTGLIGAEEPHLYALDSATGRVAWQHVGQRFITAILDPAAGRVFYATGDQEQPQLVHVFSVNVASGEKTKLTSLAVPRAVGLVRLAQAGKQLYAGAFIEDAQAMKNRTQIFALDLETRRTLWEKSYEYAIDRPLAGVFEARGSHFIYSVDRDLWIVEGASGTPYAQHSEPTSIVPSLVFLPEETAQDSDWFYFTTGDQSLVAYNLHRKEVGWRMKVPGLEQTALLCTCWVSGDTWIEDDGKSVFAVDLRAKTPEQQRLKWRLTAEGDTRFTRIFFSSGHLVVFRDDNVGLEIDPASGRVLAEHTLLWEPSQIFVRENVAYLFTRDGDAYSLQLTASKKLRAEQ